MNDDRHGCRRICRSPNDADAESHALLTSAFRRNRQHGHEADAGSLGCAGRSGRLSGKASCPATWPGCRAPGVSGPAGWAARSLLNDLRDLIPGDYVMVCGFAHKPQTQTWFLQQTSPDDADDEAYWQHKQDCPPLCYPERGGDLRQVVKYSDFYSPRQWHNSGIYRDYFRVAGVEHRLVLFLPAPGWAQKDGTLRLAFSRESGRITPSVTAGC